MRTRILMLGGEKGSWDVRGKQIGAALGATVTTRPSRADWIWADVAICVKQALARFGHEARRRNLPMIWDALDYWQQPQENSRGETETLTAFAELCAMYRPSVVIGATQAMATAINGVYLPHHHRPGLLRTPFRAELRTVAYEGRVKYLGWWREPLEAACARLGATFVINPTSLTDADVLVALRGGEWDGWVCRQWKSGVKFINALVAGRPVVTQTCAAFDEIGPTGVTVERPDELEAAIQSAFRLRSFAYAEAEKRRDEFSLAHITKQYRVLVQSALRRAA